MLLHVYVCLFIDYGSRIRVFVCLYTFVTCDTASSLSPPVLFGCRDSHGNKYPVRRTRFPSFVACRWLGALQEPFSEGKDRNAANAVAARLLDVAKTIWS